MRHWTRRALFRYTIFDFFSSLLDPERIERALKRGPEAFGYDTGLWTSARVADLIEQECGIAYHPGNVWRLLRQLGWSCQRPTGRALERDERAIAQWKRKRWPEIKKSPKTRVRHRLRRRKRTEPETISLPNLGTARPDSRAAVSLQLESLVRDGWCNKDAYGSNSFPLTLRVKLGRVSLEPLETTRAA
ncbi:MAG: helix-turn-helix domain-containing protein [Candidatus Acidiferrales bacterium]